MALGGNLMSGLGLEPWQRKTLLAWYVVFIIVNVVCETGMFGLPSNSDISERFATPITPSNWTFSIWGLIFLLQGFGVTYAFFGDKDSEKGAGYALARTRFSGTGGTLSLEFTLSCHARKAPGEAT